MRSRSWWGLAAAAAVVIILPFIMGYLLLEQSRQAEESYDRVQHTHQVREKLEEIRDLARDAESLQRAFLLTKNEDFESDFRTLIQSTPIPVQEFKDLIQDNAEQSARFEKCLITLRERLDILDANARDADTLDKPTLLKRLMLGAEKSAELEKKIAELDHEEKRLLGMRTAQFVEANESFRNIAAKMVGGGLVVLLAVGFMLYQENRARAQYEVKLADARDAALDAVKTTSAFVASVSHEIRTPMNGVLGTADLLLRDASLTPKLRDGLDTIRTSGRSLLAIINDILDLSKLQAGEMAFVNEPFSPAEVVEEVISLFAATTARKGLELTPHLSPDVPLQIRGDRLRLRQILLNLVSNSVKFTEQGGVTVHVVRRREVESDGRVCLRFDVSDTGPGIAKEVQNRLFQPFAQVDVKLAQRHGGTGLGLAVSRELVQRMNGVMSVESTLGHGATFWFTAVFGEVDNMAVARTLESRPLLILENRPMTADALQTHAVAWGLNPRIYGQMGEVPSDSPWEAEPPVQAIIIGSSVAHDWLESLRRLRSRDWLASVPVFVMTDQEELSEEALAREGIVGTLNYPFRPSELYDRLAGVTEPKAPVALPDRLELTPARLIVADDNPVNQRVIRNQLEHLGMEVVMCSDGLEAVARVQEEAGVLVLMDCQMPEMDGFEATRTIRQWEHSLGRKPIPIIAVTAHVMSGDAEQCLESGMNAYLSKPVELDRLQQMLFTWLPRTGSAAGHGPRSQNASASQPTVESVSVNEAQLRGCLTGEPELDADLVQMAVTQVAETLVKMKTALQDGSDAAWRQAAHRARGSCGTMGFTSIAALFQVAEFEATSQEARNRVLTDLHEALPALVARLAALDFPVTLTPASET